MRKTKCLACRTRNSITITEEAWTPLCGRCLDRVGCDDIKVGQRAVCEIGSYAGTVQAIADGYVVIRMNDGNDIWAPESECVGGEPSDRSNAQPRCDATLLGDVK
jgi:hypothetical protein